jgi:hypothetical protein
MCRYFLFLTASMKISFRFYLESKLKGCVLRYLIIVLMQKMYWCCQQEKNLRNIIFVRLGVHSVPVIPAFLSFWLSVQFLLCDRSICCLVFTNSPNNWSKQSGNRNMQPNVEHHGPLKSLTIVSISQATFFTSMFGHYHEKEVQIHLHCKINWPLYNLHYGQSSR